MADLTVKSSPGQAKFERVTPRTEARGTSTPGAGNSGSANRPVGDSVQISARGADVLATEAEKMPVNTERVEAIKQAIREGKYKVNPEAIADRLIATARELVEKQRV